MAPSAPPPGRALRSALRAGLRHHRPVRTVHQALRSERFEHDIEVGLERFEGPEFQVRLGDLAGELAVDVPAFRQFAHVPVQWRDDAVFNPRLQDVVQDQDLFGVAIDEVDRRVS
jgi:hypothetical protein